MTDQAEQFEGWVILELMGHRRLAGYLREQEVAGASFLRLDVPAGEAQQLDLLAGGYKITNHHAEPGPPSEWERSQFYSPQAVYAIHPVDEGTARLCAQRWRHDPVQRWELPQLQAPAQDREREDMGRLLDELDEADEGDEYQFDPYEVEDEGEDDG